MDRNYCFHHRKSQIDYKNDRRRNFIISGNNINLIDFDLQDTFGNSIAPVEKRSSTSGELMISYDFVKPYTYFLFIYSKSPTNVPTNNFRLHH